MITNGTRVRIIPHEGFRQQMFGFATMMGIDTEDDSVFIVVACDNGTDEPIYAEYVQAVSIEEEEAVALIRENGGRDAAMTDAGQRARNARAIGNKRLAEFYAVVAAFLSNA